MKIETKRDRRERIRLRLRKRIQGTAERPRLAVFRSEAHIYVQAIDDMQGRTIVAVSSVEPEVRSKLAEGARGSNKAGAAMVGRVAAERLKGKGITRIVFDRGGFLYHGRVKAVADAAREAGLQF
jgi:large subunit ribosomal protein L18